MTQRVTVLWIMVALSGMVSLAPRVACGEPPAKAEVLSATDRAVRAVAQAWRAAYNAGDAAAVASLYTPDAYYVSAHVVVARKVDGRWLMVAHETVVADQP